jgi:hypothetical protein
MSCSLRHEEQTNADRHRRITEGFAKAVEQLGSDKLVAAWLSFTARIGSTRQFRR